VTYLIWVIILKCLPGHAAVSSMEFRNSCELKSFSFNLAAQSLGISRGVDRVGGMPLVSW